MKRKRNKTRLARNEKVRMTAYFRGRLLERRQQAFQRLRHGLESLDEGGNGSSGDFADMAASSTDRETLYGIGSVESDALYRIDHALQRIDEGTYGLCEDCGGPIPRARLRALPFAALCVPCQQREEREDATGEASGATWRAEDEYDSEESEAAAVLRGSRPGG